MKGCKKPNILIVKEFLEKEKPEEYDFKFLDDNLKKYDNALVRQLQYKNMKNKRDPDCSELNMSIQCILLSAKGYEVEGYIGRYIVLLDGTILETDTINSFISMYKGALITWLNDYKEICISIGATGGFLNELGKIIRNIDKFEIGNQNLSNEINVLASRAHTIGNFNVGPIGFNCKNMFSKAKLYSAKNWECFDRFDLFIKNVICNKAMSQWKEWFSYNIFSTFLDNYFEKIYLAEPNKIDFQRSLLVDIGIKIEDRIPLVNNLILKRGQCMVKALRDNLK